MDILPALSTWLSSTESKLQKLHMDLGMYPVIPPEELRALLVALPNLTNLLIGGTVQLNAAVELLNRNLNPYICPKLTTLKYYFCDVALDALDGVVRSRMEPTGNPDEDELLKSLRVEGGCWFDQDGQATGNDSFRCPYITELKNDYPGVVYFEFIGDTPRVRI
ncbi:hypothetical protein M422DRAFT_255897 [Sphaerobolus stellatus SS14]|nr:hypothetical protein M422DRAFT_255897 [Sphaerobolus stellatus SS14]